MFSKFRWLVCVLAVLLSGYALAATVTYNNLVSFNTAAGSPPISLNFDSITKNTDIGGQTINGITFIQTGSPLIVVAAAETVSGYGNPANDLSATSGANVLSPGGVSLCPGPNPACEYDSVTLLFTTPLTAFGFDHLSQSADGASYTSFALYDSANVQFMSGIIGISSLPGGIAGADFWGFVSSTPVAKLVITDTDNNNINPDNNIGFDTFRYAYTPPPTTAPEPATLCLLGIGLASLLGLKRRR